MAIPPRHHSPSPTSTTVLEALYRAWQGGAVLTADQAVRAARAAHPGIDPEGVAGALDALTRAGVARRVGDGWSLHSPYWTSPEARTTPR